jgi:nucleoside permease NupC
MIGLVGIVALMAIAFLLSNDRRRVQPRIIGWGFALQLASPVRAADPRGDAAVLVGQRPRQRIHRLRGRRHRFVFGDWPSFAIVQRPGRTA